LGWHEHDHAPFHGTERFFRPGSATHLVSDWIPALEGVEERLERGATVADIGCWYGGQTVECDDQRQQVSAAGRFNREAPRSLRAGTCRLPAIVC
jgi:hypothetical protein